MTDTLRTRDWQLIVRGQKKEFQVASCAEAVALQMALLKEISGLVQALTDVIKEIYVLKKRVDWESFAQEVSRPNRNAAQPSLAGKNLRVVPNRPSSKQ